VGPNERVDRIRRIQLNDLEKIPFFLVADLLYVTTGPDLVLAQWLFYCYVVSRLLHFLAYMTAQLHDIRATFWTVGSPDLHDRRNAGEPQPTSLSRSLKRQ